MKSQPFYHQNIDYLSGKFFAIDKDKACLQTLTNIPNEEQIVNTIKVNPKNVYMGTYPIYSGRLLYLDRDDVQNLKIGQKIYLAKWGYALVSNIASKCYGIYDVTGEFVFNEEFIKKDDEAVNQPWVIAKEDMKTNLILADSVKFQHPKLRECWTEPHVKNQLEDYTINFNEDNETHYQVKRKSKKNEDHDEVIECFLMEEVPDLREGYELHKSSSILQSDQQPENEKQSLEVSGGKLHDSKCNLKKSPIIERRKIVYASKNIAEPGQEQHHKQTTPVMKYDQSKEPKINILINECNQQDMQQGIKKHMYDSLEPEKFAKIMNKKYLHRSSSIEEKQQPQANDEIMYSKFQVNVGLMEVLEDFEKFVNKVRYFTYFSPEEMMELIRIGEVEEKKFKKIQQTLNKYLSNARDSIWMKNQRMNKGGAWRVPENETDDRKESLCIKPENRDLSQKKAKDDAVYKLFQPYKFDAMGQAIYNRELAKKKNRLSVPKSQENLQCLDQEGRKSDRESNAGDSKSQKIGRRNSVSGSNQGRSGRNLVRPNIPKGSNQQKPPIPSPIQNVVNKRIKSNVELPNRDRSTSIQSKQDDCNELLKTQRSGSLFASELGFRIRPDSVERTIDKQANNVTFVMPKLKNQTSMNLNKFKKTKLIIKSHNELPADGDLNKSEKLNPRKFNLTKPMNERIQTANKRFSQSYGGTGKQDESGRKVYTMHGVKLPGVGQQSQAVSQLYDNEIVEGVGDSQEPRLDQTDKV